MGKAYRYYANEREVMKDCLNTKLNVEETESLFKVLKKRFRFSHKLVIVDAERLGGNCSAQRVKLKKNNLNLLYLIHECAHAVQWTNRHKNLAWHRRMERRGIEVFPNTKRKTWHNKHHMKIMERMRDFIDREHLMLRRD